MLSTVLHLDLAIAAQASPRALSDQWSHVPQRPASASALQHLGDVLRIIGDLSLSRQMLEHSLEIAQHNQDAPAIATAHFNLANLTRTDAYVTLRTANLTASKAVELVRLNQEGDRRRGIQDAEVFVNTLSQTLDHYHQAIDPALPPITNLQTQLNQLRVLIELRHPEEAQELIHQIQPQIEQLPTHRETTYARINLAQSIVQLDTQTQTTSSHTKDTWIAAAQLLSMAVQQAQDMGDVRAESYALGNLAHLYEQTHQLEAAQQVTHRALTLAQTYHFSDIAYRWQWQLGRVLQSQAEVLKTQNISQFNQKHTEAIAAYTAAVDTLKSIRSDLVAITPEEQFSFRDTIEPIYRQLVTLLLTPSPTSDPSSLKQQTLKDTRDVIESLQLAELDDFFRQACLTVEPSFVDQIDDTAAVLYPVVLPDRLVIILSVSSHDSPQQTSTLSYATVPVSRDRVEAATELLRDSLDQPNDSRFLAPAQQLYDWLIRPIEAQLDTAQVKTLVFVMDDVLRSIPVAALHDGHRYLIEHPYGIALTPGLQLLEPLSSQSGSSQSLLLAGLTEGHSGFSPLPNVRDELHQIQSIFPKTTTLLDSDQSHENQHLSPEPLGIRIDGEFTRENFSEMMRDRAFPVVHLATHGQFSSQVNNTFVLTKDGQLSIEELKALLQSTTVQQQRPLELLVLSACETASGDRRAALGLAGMAVRAGAQSTIATLWNINDASSASFMGELYYSLSTKVNKAAALREAQLSMLKDPNYQHPYFWAPYILIGRWQ
ncbi:MAG: CHAT domain-containing protein [Merismopedia sp. SIO2A8]|nr:CHAT domain-containing protein [Merismopedia sp. SIO2A8]